MMAMFGGGFLLDSLGYWTFNLVYVWPLILIGFGTAVLLGRAQRMEVEEKRSSDLATAEQRVRIAQELHDIVAHSVSLMTVQITAARKVLDRKPEDANKALAAAEETGRKSLDELRRIVGVLRSADQSIEAASFRPEGAEERSTKSPIPGMADLESLIDEMRDAGLDVTSQLVGRQAPMSSGVQLAVYRVVQEALTNVLRHAPKAKANVGVMFRDDSVKVLVTDDGAGEVATQRKGQGHGLIGMKERVGSVGGTVEAGPAPSGGGWFVRADIPLEKK